MSVNEILAELFYMIIVAISCLIAWEFYNIKDGKLRIIIIWLFLTKIWVYGGAMIYHILLDFKYIDKVEPVVVRLILNFPMVIVMLRLYKYIRTEEYKS